MQAPLIARPRDPCNLSVGKLKSRDTLGPRILSAMGAGCAKATSKDVVFADIALDFADTTVLSDSLESRSLKVRLQALQAIAESDDALEEHHEAIARCLTDREMDVHVQLAALDLLSKSDALVSQDSTLFNEDVAYNIAYGNPKADAFAVGDAARNAQVQHVA